MWCRVFAALDTVPGQAGLEACLAGLCCSFAADAAGWYRAECVCAEGPAVVVERYTADEEGIRAELNAWAGYLETKETSARQTALMERAIQARQLFTVEAADERAAEALCRYLAGVTDGFFQVDERGFFAADGCLLVAD
jgi:hypothetical protein